MSWSPNFHCIVELQQPRETKNEIKIVLRAGYMRPVPSQTGTTWDRARSHPIQIPWDRLEK